MLRFVIVHYLAYSLLQVKVRLTERGSPSDNLAFSTTLTRFLSTTSLTTMASAFERLPPEIIEAICEALCSHCRLGLFGWLVEGKIGTERQAFRSLSLTCKRIQASAQPFLYHSPEPITRYVSFVRTLMARPDLAAHIREYYSSYRGAVDASKEEEKKIIRDVALALHLEPPEDPDLEIAMELHYKELCAEIPLALAPNIQGIVVGINIYDLKGPTTHLFLKNRFARLGGRHGFENLRRLHFDRFENLFFPISRGEVYSHLNIAPNLEELTFEGTLGLEGICWSDHVEDSKFVTHESLMAWDYAFGNLKSLSFDNCSLRLGPCIYPTSYFRTMAERSPKLCAFRFQTVSQEAPSFILKGHFTPSMFPQALEPCASTLKTLDLDLRTVIAEQDPEVTTFPVFDPCYFRVFRELTTLKLDAKSICRWLTRLDDRTLDYGPNSCIVDILSQLPNVERFRLRMIETDHDHIFKDLLCLGLEIARGKFCHLSRIEVEKAHEDLDSEGHSADYNDLKGILKDTEVRLLIS